ncbi:MAG TPA: hypothetical protein PLO37_25495 [Candidatus Hydrogenedentes bacterium]|nr:hypothetical protein [Candidatus Hydrogenedentota bacterium]HPG70213.1 hypothetical protein [Candidatus Hydrogenedentota bacterium]
MEAPLLCTAAIISRQAMLGNSVAFSDDPGVSYNAEAFCALEAPTQEEDTVCEE